RVLGTACVAAGVVQVGQAQIMTELMREHAHATVLRLNGVVADPVVRIADTHAAEAVWADTIGAIGREIGIPAVRPDRIGALRTTAGLLTLAGMDRLEVV